MVSPQSSAATNPPSLSYADRAKKAQNIKSKNLPSQRIVSQNVPVSVVPSATASTSVVSSIAPSTSSAGSSTAASASASNPSVSIDVTPASSAALSARTASGPPSPLSPTLQNTNGDVNYSDSRSSDPHTVSAPKSAPAPLVNVWNLRKAQMAQARGLSQSRPTPPSSSPRPPQRRSQDGALSPPVPPSVTPPDVTPALSNATALQNVTNHKPNPNMASRPLVNGHNAHPNDHEDPFVVRPRAAQQSPARSPPSVDDASWPEVGRSAQGDSDQAEGREKEEVQLNGKAHDAESSQSTSRKSEKTKWVQIPPQELQATADALHPNRVHPRMRPHHPRHQGYTPVSGSASASGSTSGRTHSSTGIRQTASHASSVAPSQVQSRTGSVHSSPRQPFARNRLPEENAPTGAVGYGGSNASRSLRSSRSGSSQSYRQPYPTPPAEFVPRAGAMVFQPAGVALPEQLHQGTSDGTTYYSAQIMAHPHTLSYHSPHASGSPAAAPYTLPPNVYPAQQGAPALPMHTPYATSAPYAMYPQYTYSYPPPYMYWPGAVPPLAPSHSHSRSPVAVAPAAGEGVPPPTLIARPPPPGESDAVAGYRDVGFVLPPAADYGRFGDQEVAPERGRRARELSFGSIGLEGGDIPSPALQGAVGGSLGLDVGAADEGEDAQEEGEKPFLTFSIGVAPGEPFPARIRSRTRTRSKGSSKLDDLTPANSTSEQSEPAAQAREVEEGDEAAEDAGVIDLTDSETKWEFGTTKHPEADADAGEGETMAPEATEPSPLTNALRMSPGPPAGSLGDEHVVVPPSTSHVPVYGHNGYVPPVTIPLTGSIAAPNGAISAVSPSMPRSAAPLSASSAGVSSDEWEVRDYGFGFGRMSGTGYHAVAREERILRERDRERDAREQGREWIGHPQRGAYGNGFQYERGTFPGRRGRGMGGGFGGRGYARAFSRGRGANQQRQPPFVVTQLSGTPGELNDYYSPVSVPAPPPTQLATYIPPAYDNYSFPTYPTTQQSMQAVPPLPMPLSPIPFPLDSTRYYLLGQLEYYLSPQNMAKDYFLRQKMDSRGWISISLIGSFNRVKHLTMDLQLVRDVLTLSSLVEVKDNWVRMHQWEQFVLPYAPKSVVDDDLPIDSHPSTEEGEPAADDSGEAESSHEEGEGDEEDEEDVVFVLDRDTSRSWTPEQRLG